MSRLTILHASDTHWSAKADANQEIIIRRLIDDLAVMRSREVNPDLVIFSGDLVQAGEDPTAFSAAFERLLLPLAEAADIASDMIFICPGNHDISRATAREQHLLEDGINKELVTEDALTGFLDRAAKAGTLEQIAIQRTRNYYDWFDGLFTKVDKLGPLCRTATIEVSGKSVGLALFDTSWRATGESGDVDDGYLILGSIIAEQAAEKLSNCDYKIAVLHHPFEVHAAFDRTNLERRIAKSFDLICTGHTHLPNPEKTDSMFGSSIRSQAGSLYADSRWFNGYQLIDIDFVNDQTSIYCREYFRGIDKFERAANLADADPVIFPYSVKDKNHVDQIELLLQSNRGKIKSNFVKHINFTNNTGMSDECIIDGYACPKMFVKKETQVDESGNISELSHKIDIAELIGGGSNVLIHGGRQSGKTALKLNLALEIAGGANGTARIPVVLDVSKFQFNLYGLKRALSAAYDVPPQFELEKAVKAGSFVFLFEDIGSLDEVGLKRLKKFIDAFSPNRAFVFGCPDTNSMSKERHFHRVFPEFVSVGLGELTRGAIRKMTKAWFEDSGEAKSKFELVVSQINRDGLPRTAYMVGLLLWAAKQGQQGDRLNEAILLQNVLDHLLDRANFRTAKRGALTTRGKELLLNKVANKLDECGGNARSVEIISWVDNYFEKKKLKHDAMEVVGELVSCGILRNEEGSISFRYKCFQEYFIALGMLDPVERARKTDGILFLDRAREVELLSGLQSENDQLIQNIVSVLAARMPRDLHKVSYADFEAQMRLSSGKFVTREKLRKIRRTRLTEEQLDSVMDAIDERAAARGDRPVSESLEEVDGDFARAASNRQADAVRADIESDAEYFRPGTYMAGLSILARVIRNSDFTDYDVKAPALRCLLEQWCRIHVLLTKEARWILEQFEENEDDKLSEEDFETLVRIISKMMFGAVGSGLVADLSTPALSESLYELDAEGFLQSGKQILGLFLLEDCDDQNWPAKWKAVIDDRKSTGFEIDVLIDRLWRSVNRKALDDEQDRRVIKVVDAVEGRFDWGNEKKSSVLQDIREMTTIKKATEG